MKLLSKSRVARLVSKSRVARLVSKSRVARFVYKSRVARLELLFKELNERYFDGILAPIPLLFSGRLKTTGGQYFKKPRRLIQISIRYLELTNAWDEIRDTLGHEMIHYWLDHHEKPCGHTPEFRKILNKCGFNRYSRLPKLKGKHHYQCPACNTSYYPRKRGSWSCAPCSGKRFNPMFKLVLCDKIAPGMSAQP